MSGCEQRLELRSDSLERALVELTSNAAGTELSQHDIDKANGVIGEDVWRSL